MKLQKAYNITVWDKMRLWLFCICTLTVVASSVIVYSSWKTNCVLQNVLQDKLLAVKCINEARAEARNMEALATELCIGNLNKGQEQNIIQEIEIRADHFDQLLAQYEQTEIGLKQSEKITDLKTELRTIRSKRIQATALAMKGDKEGSYLFFSQEIAPKIDKTNTMITELSDVAINQANKDYHRATIDMGIAIFLIIAMTVFVLYICLLMKRALFLQQISAYWQRHRKTTDQASGLRRLKQKNEYNRQHDNR